MKEYIIYTDGACKGNPGPGGWAAVIDDSLIISGHETYTTNNRMELKAILRAMQYITKSNKSALALLYTDSRYCADSLNSRLEDWKKRNWKNIKNIDLWQEIDILNQKANIRYVWIRRGENNISDKYARRAATNPQIGEYLVEKK